MRLRDQRTNRAAKPKTPAAPLATVARGWAAAEEEDDLAVDGEVDSAPEPEAPEPEVPEVPEPEVPEPEAPEVVPLVAPFDGGAVV
jgi:hypothetical protein